MQSSMSSPIDLNRRYTIDQSCELLQQSRARLYKKINAGHLRVIKDGRRVYVPGQEIARLSTLPDIETNSATNVLAMSAGETLL